MRESALVLVLLLFAAAALAEERPPTPDYSRGALLHVLAPTPDSARPPGKIRWHIGSIDFRALRMDWRFSYLPFLAPLPGARLEDGATIPNPFALTDTPYASARPPSPEQDRSPEVQREYQRILRFSSR